MALAIEVAGLLTALTRKNMYHLQEKGKVREKLATNVTIVVVTLIQFTSSRGVVKDFNARPFSRMFLRTQMLTKLGPSGRKISTVPVIFSQNFAP